MELTPERYTREANDFLKNFHNEFSHSVERNEFDALVELKFCRQRRADRDENLIKNSHAADRPVAVDEAVFLKFKFSFLFPLFSLPETLV